MKALANVFASMFGNQPLDHEQARSRQIHLEWDRQRANATSDSEREEIDAIFSRNL